MQDKYDVDVFFHHKICKHHMASRLMHHVIDVAHCVLYWFYFWALPFYNPFYFFVRYILIHNSIFARDFYPRHRLRRSPSPRDQGRLGRNPSEGETTPPAGAGPPLRGRGTRYPTVVGVRHPRVQFFPRVLLRGRFHGHGGHTRRCQLESVDQQSSFR